MKMSRKTTKMSIKSCDRNYSFLSVHCPVECVFLQEDVDLSFLGFTERTELDAAPSHGHRGKLVDLGYIPI